MRIILSVFFVAISFLNLSAQKEDYIWLTGYSGPTSNLGRTIIDFNVDPPQITDAFFPISFFLTDASICDKEGNLLIYTNGVTIGNKNYEVMENGDSLGLDDYHWSWGLEGEDGLPVPQAALILKKPGHDSTYLVIYVELSDLPSPNGSNSSIQRSFYSTIDISPSNDLGVVSEKNVPLIEDELERGKITGVRHANGRDWWVLITKSDTNLYYTLKVSPLGVEDSFTQSIGEHSISGNAGQAVFSPDGSKYARFGVLYLDEPGQIDLFDFDRCTGMLSNPIHIPIDTTENGFVDGARGGMAFSPNSELLYHSRSNKIVQYDMTANDIIASADTVAVYDGFTDPIINTPTTFGMAQLGPNGKIYIATTGNTRYFHTIHDPDVLGIGCDVQQHDVNLIKLNDWSIPNYPNFRLKALVGSSCDTLRPIAAFNYDSLSSIFFADESLRVPTEWYWTFGDGASSIEQNPEHAYAEDGVFEVCLIASNEAGSDTTCQELVIMTTNLDELELNSFQVFPNPTIDQLSIELPNQGLKNWSILNTLGKKIKEGTFISDFETIYLKELPKGIYWLNVEHLGIKKVVIQ